MAKRLFDIVFAGLGLLLLSPVLLMIAIWVRLDSPGPALFRQRRVGRHGQPFTIHKFRTMRADAPGLGPQITIGADPRITGSGATLRHYKLDELPQLWDVLRGAMSLVGPRPEVARYVALYPDDVRELVLSVRPGITDLASIEYRDESAVLARASNPEHSYVHIVMPAKVALAVRYVRTRSLAGDVRLIFRTIGAILGR